MDRYKLSLLIIVVIAAGARLTALDYSPPSLNWDEAAIGYNAYSLLKTGRDEFGSIMPISFRSFDDYKPPVYVYLTVPAIAFGGLNAISVRLVSAIAGIASVVVLYAIARLVSGKRSVGLFSALGLAITPWGVHFSRIAFEANVALLMFLISLLAALRKKNMVAVIFGGLGALTYHSAKVYLPILLGWVVTRAWKNKKIWISAGVVLAMVGAVTVFGGGLARLGSAGLGDVTVPQIANRYLAYFNPVNLFVRGSNEPNQKTPGFGTFYVWEVVTVMIGLVAMIDQKKRFAPLLFWMAIGSVPAIITKGWFVPVRVLPLMAMLCIAGGVGMMRLWKTSRIGFGLLTGWAILSLGWFGIAEGWMLPYKNYGDWQWGFSEVAEVIRQDYDKYDRIVWETGQAQPHIFALFYLQYPPDRYQREIGVVPAPRKNFDFGRIEFRKIYWPDDRGAKNTLFIGGVYSLPEADLKRDGVTYVDTIDPQGYINYRIAAVD